MGKPAARLTDMHTCPMVTPGVPPIPHVGGPIVSPGVPTVLIGFMPAATVGDMCVCVGPPDSIAMGSPTVFIGNKMAARMGDPTVHGGVIVVGCPTVLIGEVGMGATTTPPAVKNDKYLKALKMAILQGDASTKEIEAAYAQAQVEILEAASSALGTLSSLISGNVWGVGTGLAKQTSDLLKNIGFTEHAKALSTASDIVDLASGLYDAGNYLASIKQNISKITMLCDKYSSDGEQFLSKVMNAKIDSKLATDAQALIEPIETAMSTIKDAFFKD